jgi:hypothetical protein
MYDPQINHAAVTIVPRPVPVHPSRWTTLGPILVGALGLMLAAATLTMFLLWKGSVAVQIGQLRSQLTTAQAQATTASTGVAGVSRRLDGTSHDVNELQALVGSYSFVCSQDLTGPNGPAMFVFPCQQKS